MAKPKSPLLSLGARGTIGDTLTYQKRGREHIVREKPIPRDPYSLNQAYQRWDYRDYAYLWTLLSNSEKQVYRTKASRYHITGFSQFMREQLKALTDLASRWHLDERGGAIAYDSSRNNNTGTIVGASPATGLIAGGYYFDGLNDLITVPHNPLLDVSDEYTISFFLNLALDQESALIGKRRDASNAFFFQYHPADGIRIQIHDAGIWYARQTNPIAIIDEWTHAVATYVRATNTITLFINGTEIGVGVAVRRDAPVPTTLYIGHHGTLPALWLKGTLDELRIDNRIPDLTEINRHSERRYLLS